MSPSLAAKMSILGKNDQKRFTIWKIKIVFHIEAIVTEPFFKLLYFKMGSIVYIWTFDQWLS